MHVCMLSCFSPIQLFATLWTRACQAPLSMEFSRKDTAVGCCALLWGIFLTQGSTLLPLVPPERPKGKYRFIKIYVYNIHTCVCVTL